MKTHLALLRGINVSGKNIIKMEEFRKLLTAIGFNNVSTYIQSGNVFFESDKTIDFSVEISKLIKDNYGYDIKVLMVNKNDLAFVLQNNPFFEKVGSSAQENTKNLYISFLSEIPKKEDYNELLALDFKGDEFVLQERFLFLKYKDSAANTKLDNKIIENKLKVVSTTRNWNTVNKLYQMYDETSF